MQPRSAPAPSFPGHVLSIGNIWAHTHPLCWPWSWAAGGEPRAPLGMAQRPSGSFKSAGFVCDAQQDVRTERKRWKKWHRAASSLGVSRIHLHPSPPALQQTGEGGIPSEKPPKSSLCLDGLQTQCIPEQGVIQPVPQGGCRGRKARQDTSCCSSRPPSQQNHGLSLSLSRERKQLVHQCLCFSRELQLCCCTIGSKNFVQ